MAAAPSRILLVHGTILIPWLMRDPQWIRPHHPFRERLAEAYPEAEIVPFRWRGGNWHADRLRAAHELAEVIDAEDGSLLVIGHSHGGNVARMALQLAQEREAETRLITLATPFLNVRWHPRDWTGRRRPTVSWQTWWSFTWSAALGVLVMTSLSAGVQGADPLGSRIDTPAPDAPAVSTWLTWWLALGGFVVGLTLVLAVALALLYGALQMLGGLLVGRTNRSLGINHGHDWLTDVDTREARGALAGTPAEVVAVENDEAAWSLNLGQAAGSIGAVLGSSADPRRGHGRARLALNLLTTAGVLLALRSSTGWEIRFPALKVLSWVQGPSGGYGDEALAVIGVLLLLFAVAGLVGLGIQLFEYLTAGWDSLVVTDRARISVSTAPPGSSTVTLLDLGQTRHPGLRHSRIYEDDTSVDTILAVAGRVWPGSVAPVAAA